MEDNQKAGGYINSATGLTKENDINFQKQAIKDYALKCGIPLYDYYMDTCGQEVALDKRDGYLNLNKDITAGHINAVIVHSFDNFTRDEREKQGLLHNFAEKGVEIFVASTDEYINPSDPITHEQRLLGQAMRDTEKISARHEKTHQNS